MIYLDHAATSPPLPEVAEAVRACLSDGFGNPSSLHAAGRHARKTLEDTRERVAAELGASPKEIVFTSGATEADNLAIFGTAAAAGSRRHVLVSAIEHPAVLEPARRLADRGFDVELVPVGGGGVVDPAEVERRLRPDTALVSVMLVNNEVGTIQPVAGIAAYARRVGALVHCDATQGAGKLALRVSELGADLVAISAHKLGGPKGAGALYVRRGVDLVPLLYGGGHEFERRAGTENVAGAVGLAAALAEWSARRDEHAARLAGLRDRLEARVLAAIPTVRRNGDPERRLPAFSNLSFEGADGEALLIALDLEGVCVSTGSACASLAAEPSHVLKAMGLPEARVRSALRFTLGIENTPGEVDQVVEILAKVVARIRAVSPAWSGS